MNAAEFTHWQAAVAAYTAKSGPERLPGLISRTALTPRLGSDLQQLRFSPNGNYILAQDESGIDVLSHRPFDRLFRIDATDADAAHFTPDSAQIVFGNKNSRVERWDVASRAPLDARDILTPNGCVTRLLAADAKTFACGEPGGDLVLIDVVSGDEILREKDFGKDHFPVQAFSPDGQTFLAAARHPTSSAALFYGVPGRTRAAVPAAARKLLTGGFTFLSANQLLIFNAGDPSQSGVYALPSFDSVSTIELLPAAYVAPSAEGFVLLRPFRDFAVAVLDLSAKQIFKTSKLSAIDLYGDEFVSQRAFGELGLYGTKNNELRASIKTEPGKFGSLASIAISADSRFLSVSNRSRAKVWDLSTGQYVFDLRAADASSFLPDGTLLVTLPAVPGQPAKYMLLDPSAKTMLKSAERKTEPSSRQYGPFNLLIKPSKFTYYERSASGGLMDAMLEVREGLTPALLWSRAFKDMPSVWFDMTAQVFTLGWSSKTETGQSEIKADAGARKRWDAMDKTQSALVLSVLDARSGDVRSRTLIDTGNDSFHPYYAYPLGKLLLASDATLGTLIFSLDTGDLLARKAGEILDANAELNLLVIRSTPTQIKLCELKGMRELASYDFAADVLRAHLMGKENELLVVAQNQEVLRSRLPEKN